jgi:hypothetical protein
MAGKLGASELEIGMIVYGEVDLGTFDPGDTLEFDTRMVVIADGNGRRYAAWLAAGSVTDSNAAVIPIDHEGYDLYRTQADAIRAAIRSDRDYFDERMAVVTAAEQFLAGQVPRG